MSELLGNYVGGRWVGGTDGGTPLLDPVLGTELVRVSSAGLDLTQAFAFARSEGGGALRAMRYAQRAAMLGRCADVLKANRDRYYDIALTNSGTTKADSGPDIDGAIFTLNWYARAGAALGEAHALLDGAAVGLNKDGSFKSRHVLVPARGVALCINAFNFPAWGLWEKTAPALLSGVPVIAKPATVTAWLAQQMVADIVAAKVLPDGALSIVCGNSAGLLDPLGPQDLLSFTGSAETAGVLRGHAALRRHSVRANMEADSLNSALLDPDAAPGSEPFALLVRETLREMTVKSGQKCTAIRRIFVPEASFDAAADALRAELAKVVTGNPRDASVRMGSLVSRAQRDTVLDGIAQLKGEATVLFDGADTPFVAADPAIAACVAPVLLGLRDARRAGAVHALEVFGPVATLIGYRDLASAYEMIHAGGGSLVSSLYSANPDFIATASLELAASHGRIHAISPAIAATQTGHGNVMPMSIHGGPGRAGGGQELGGLRALDFYHRRCAFQAETAAIHAVEATAVTWAC